MFWNFELVVLIEPGTQKLVNWHKPYSLACEVRDTIRLESIVLRCLTIQLATMAVAWCQERPAANELTKRGRMDSSFHDGVFASYGFEFTIAGMHRHRIQATTVWRDIMTDVLMYALKQNNHRKSNSDPKYPLAYNLRKRFNNSPAYALCSAKAKRKQDHALVIRRVWNLCTQVKRVTKRSVNNLLAKAMSIMAEDKGTKTETVDRRWTYIFKGLDPSVALTSKFVSAYKATKKNKGNPQARGLNAQEQNVHDTQVDNLLALGKQVPFWVRPDGPAKAKALELPKADKKKYPHVFDQVTFQGIKRRLYKTKSKLKCNQVLHKNRNDGAIYSQNKGFVLAHLLDK